MDDSRDYSGFGDQNQCYRSGNAPVFIGFGCVVLGLILVGMATAFYNRYLNKSYWERHSVALERRDLLPWDN